jgi:hypothetical protein
MEASLVDVKDLGLAGEEGNRVLELFEKRPVSLDGLARAFLQFVSSPSYDEVVKNATSPRGLDFPSSTDIRPPVRSQCSGVSWDQDVFCGADG